MAPIIKVTSLKRGKRNKRSQAAKMRWKSCNANIIDINVTPLEDIENQPLALIHQDDNVDDIHLTPLEDICHSDSSSISSSNSHIIANKPWIPQDEYDEIMNHELSTEQPSGSSNEVLSGRRIVKIQHVIEKCLLLTKTHYSICTSGQLSIFKERRNGFFTEVTLKCNMCNRDYIISSEEKGNLSTAEIYQLAVWGTVSTGSTFSHLEEFCYILDVPCISSGKFYPIQNQNQSKVTKKYKKSRKMVTASTSKSARKNLDYGKYAMQVPLSDDQVEEECERRLAALDEIPYNDIEFIEKNTRGQFINKMYRDERRERLTASNFARVCKLRASTSCHNTVKALLQPTFLGNSATDYGKENEAVALEHLRKLLSKDEIASCGLFIDRVHKFLGASPDGIIPEERTIVEIKCPHIFAKENITIEKAAETKKNFCLAKIDGNLQLKPFHDYYYQIQGQLHITKMDKCIFVVYAGDHQNLFVQDIVRSDQFWEDNMVEKLTRFYRFCILPEIVRENLKRGLLCKDPDYIIAEQEKD